MNQQLLIDIILIFISLSSSAEMTLYLKGYALKMVSDQQLILEYV
jgi:hypothetical protein